MDRIENRELILHVVVVDVLWCLMCHVLWCPLRHWCRQNMYVCVWSVCLKKMDLLVFVSLSVFFPLLHLFLQQVSQSHSQDWSICLFLTLPPSAFSFSPCLFLLPPSLIPLLWVIGCVAVYLLCPQGETQLTLYANIHSAIISNLFHTHCGFHSV